MLERRINQMIALRRGRANRPATGESPCQEVVIAIQGGDVNSVGTTHPAQHLQAALDERVHGLEISLTFLQADAFEEKTGLRGSGLRSLEATHHR